MTHALNSNTNPLSTDITRMDTQMKSPRGEKESGKEQRVRKIKKKEKKEENKR